MRHDSFRGGSIKTHKIQHVPRRQQREMAAEKSVGLRDKNQGALALSRFFRENETLRNYVLVKTIVDL